MGITVRFTCPRSVSRKSACGRLTFGAASKTIENARDDVVTLKNCHVINASGSARASVGEPNYCGRRKRSRGRANTAEISNATATKRRVHPHDTVDALTHIDACSHSLSNPKGGGCFGGRPLPTVFFLGTLWRS